MEREFIDVMNHVNLGEFLAVMFVCVLFVKECYKDIEKYRQKRNQSDAQSDKIKCHDEAVVRLQDKINSINNSLAQINNKIDGLSTSMVTLQVKSDHTEMIRHQDRIVQIYKDYKAKGDKASWSTVQSKSFWNMYDDYTNCGGNSFVKNIIKPYMETIPMNDEDPVIEEEVR